MLNLLFSQRSAAKQAVERLENLVAILTQRNGPEMLLVYHSNIPPVIDHKNINVITMRELPMCDLTRYDGLLIGFNVLNAMRNDLITKGPYFYPIERIYLERGETESLYHTMANLSVDLMKRQQDTGGSGFRNTQGSIEAKALQCALPGMLLDRDCAGLIGVVPVGELNWFITRKTCHYLYIAGENGENLDQTLKDLNINTGKDWVIALEELALLCPAVQSGSAQFLDLRAVLREMQRTEALQSTRKSLARHFYHLDPENEIFIQTAWALAVEYWLGKIECEDLVAICPINDFERFLDMGDSVRVYRALEITNQVSTTFPVLNQSMRDIHLNEMPDGYGKVIFALPGVHRLIRGSSESSCYDLSRVLFKAGYEKILARSLWLLSYDLLSGSIALNIDPAETRRVILDACSRACLIYNLSDPWEWRQGRWQLYLEGAYQTRQQILKQAFLESSGPESRSALADYYQAVSLWYSCAASEQPEKELEAMLENLRDFQREVRANPYADGAYTQEVAQQFELIAVGEFLLGRSSEGFSGQSEESDQSRSLLGANVHSILRQASDTTQRLPLISPQCKSAIELLRTARRNRQYLYVQERNIEVLIDQLVKMRADLQNQKRQLFIPLHEEKALIYAFDQEIQAITVMLLELESSAKLNVELKNTWVDIHQPVHLTLEITNRGRVEANALEIVLDQPRGFQLLDNSLLREIPSLRPDMSGRIEYYIRPERVGAELRLEYSFNDPSGQRHKDTWTTYLNIRSLDTQPFQIKVNRYQFGRPIQNMTEFYGRRSELQNILSLLQAGGKQNLLLRGPRRMGKTSLLYMLKIAITDPSARRFFGIPTDWDEKLDCVHPVFLSLHSFNLLSGDDASTQFFRTLLERVGSALGVQAEILDRLMTAYGQRVNAVGAVNAAIEQTQALLSLYPDQRIAVLLDEYDEVYQPGSSLDRHLREFVSSEQRLTWVIASTLALFREVKTISSPWFNVFMIIELGRLSDDAAIELVEAPTHNEHIFWRSDAIISLLAETGRHPAFTQLFCGRVISFLNQAQTNYVLQETVFSIADQIVDEQETANNHFEFFWQDTAGTGRMILLILDSKDQPLKREEIRFQLRRILAEKFGDLPRQVVLEEEEGDPIEWQEREFKQQIDWVEKITNSVSLDSQKRYSFTVPLFRRWLRRRRRYQDLEAETLEKIAREMENDGIIYRNA